MFKKSRGKTVYLKDLPEEVKRQIELAGIAKEPAPFNKYKRSAAEARTWEGVVYDSKQEMLAHQWLLRKFANTGTFVHRQTKFELQPKLPAFKLRAISYNADFVITKCKDLPELITSREDIPSDAVIVDQKGYEPQVWRIKEKLFIYKYQRVIFLPKSIKDLERFTGW